MRPKMNIYVISDNHFNHWDINRYCKRGFKTLEEMNSSMLKKWNRVVRKNDIVLIIGDLVFTKGSSEEVSKVIKKLNGRKILIKGNHDRKCVSKNTRILTKAGYKKYNEIKKGDLVPTVNLKSGKVEYNPIKDIYIYEKEPWIYKAKHRSGEMEITSQHVILYQPGSGSISKEWFKDIAENRWNTKSPMTIPDKFSSQGTFKIDINKLKLMAWVVTDGSILPHGKIILFQSKQKGINEIKELLENNKIVYQEKVRNREIKKIAGEIVKSSLPQHIFSLDLEQSRSYSKDMHYFSKYILPEYLWHLSDQDFEIFLNELIKGDGSVNKNGCRILWGKKDFLELIMGMCVTHNLSCNLLKQSGRNNYYLSIRNSGNCKQFTKKHRTIEEYNDLAWCVNVDNNTFFAELNGKTFVTGNSYSWYLSNGIDFICERMIWEFNKKKVLFIHRPQDITHNDYRTCQYIIHGHSHNNVKFLRKRKNCKIVNVCVEHIKFTPMNLVTLLNRLQQGYYDKGK